MGIKHNRSVPGATRVYGIYIANRDQGHEENASDQKSFIKNKAAHFELAWRNKSHKESKDGAKSAERPNEPNSVFFVGNPIRARDIWVAVTEFDCGKKHQDIHHQVQLHRDGAQNPKGAARVRHKEKHKAGNSDDETLKKEEMGRHAMFVQFLKKWGEIAVFRGRVHRAKGTDDPCVEFADGSQNDHHSERDNEPAEMEMA